MNYEFCQKTPSAINRCRFITYVSQIVLLHLALYGSGQNTSDPCLKFRMEMETSHKLAQDNSYVWN